MYEAEATVVFGKVRLRSSNAGKRKLCLISWMIGSYWTFKWRDQSSSSGRCIWQRLIGWTRAVFKQGESGMGGLSSKFSCGNGIVAWMRDVTVGMERRLRGLANLASNWMWVWNYWKWQCDLRLIPYLRCHHSYLVKMDYSLLLLPVSEMLLELIMRISPKWSKVL